MSTTRATMKHAAVYSAAAMAGRLIGFFMLPFYAHILRGHGYAVIGMLDVGLGFLLALLAYGMQGSIIRLYHDEKDPARKPVVVSSGIILIGTITALLTIPLLILSKPIAAFLVDDAGLYKLVIMALISFNLDMVGQAASSWLLVRSRSSQLAGLSLLRLFIGLSLNIYLIVIKDMGLNGYFISALATNAFSCLIFVGIAFRDCGREFDPAIARAVGGFLFPLIPGSIASWIGRQIERVFAKTLINLDSVGIMEMGYKFPTLISILVIRPFMRSWETRRFEIADEPGAPETISRMFTYFLFIICWAGLVMAVVIKPVLEIMTPPEFHIAYRIARVEIVTIILFGTQRQLMFGLAYAKDTPMLSKLRTGMAAVKVFLSYYFISTWGIYGAAFSAAICGFFSTILIFHYSQKKYRLHLEWNALIAIVVTAGLMFVWLTRWDFSSTEAFRILDGQILPWIQNGISQTFLGNWKDGKLIIALGERSQWVAEIIINGSLAATFILVLPIIHPPARQYVRDWIRRKFKLNQG